MPLKVTGVEELRRDGALVGLRVFGEWNHPKHGSQPIRVRVDGPNLQAYDNAPNDTAKENVAKGIAQSEINKRTPELDKAPLPPVSTIITYVERF